MTTRSRAIALLVALALVASCGSDPDADTTAGDGGGTTSSATSEEAGAPAVDPDGVFRFAHYYELSRFDPHRAANASDALSLFLTYDRLTHLTTESEPAPGLAESWTYSEDGLRLELALREGVTFHDGQPFDAAAVKANLERAKTLEGSVVAGDLALVTSIDVVDDLTVALTLSEPQASLLAILSDRAGAMISPAAFENPDLEQAPVGAGMYRVVEYRAGDRIIYERYEDYWDPEAVGSQRFEFHLLGEAQTRLNGLVTGQFDAAVLEPAQVEEAELAGLDVENRTTVIYQQMYMNRTREPFDDVNVRRALNHAIDRDMIVQAVDFGLGEPNSQIFPEGYWAFDPETGTDFYSYDPDKARELLAEAGLADGFSFEMLLPTPGTSAAIAEILQAQFAEIGVDMTIVQTPAQTVADLFFVQKDGVAMLGVWTGRQDPSMTTALRWTSTGFSNPGGHTTPEVEALHREALTTLDPDERADAMHRLVRAGAEEALDLVIYNPVSVVASTDQVAVPPQLILNGKLEFRGTGLAAG
jgi:peptide/nickel transport system substrate-binding protein